MTHTEKIKKKCVICGNSIEYYYYPLCFDCRPYRYPKQKHPHQKIRSNQIWKDNRLKRLKESDYQCDWCKTASDNKLIIHHQMGLDYTTYEKIWENIIVTKGKNLIKHEGTWKEFQENLFSNESITKLKEELQKQHLKKTNAEKKNTCPSCGTANLAERKVKKPRFRCNKCHREFSEPIFQIPKHYFLPDNILKKKVENRISLMFKNKIIIEFYNELLSVYQEDVNRIVDEYLAMKNTLVLCKRCHFAIEKGLRLCPICQQNYTNPYYNNCRNCQEQEFVKLNGAYYIIEESKTAYIIRSIYDKKLVNLIKGKLWMGRKWDSKEKVWKIDKYAFGTIAKEILDYIFSTGRSFKLNYAKKAQQEVREGLRNNINYRKLLLSEFPICNDEIKGYCNHAGSYSYGDKIKCNKRECYEYFPEGLNQEEIITLLTKVSLVDNAKKLGLS